MTSAVPIETTRIHSLAGLTGDRTVWVTTRPFRAPHYTISDAGLIGGGHVPMLGEESLAPHGVLRLDARPECRCRVLAVSRQPLEESVIYLQSDRGRDRNPSASGRGAGDAAVHAERARGLSRETAQPSAD